MAIRMFHPKHGYHVVYGNSEVDKHKLNGWEVETPPVCVTDTPNTHDLSVDIVEATRQAYIAKFGKRPHHMMKLENIQKAINGDS